MLALSRLQKIRLSVALIGIVIWFNAVRFDDARVRLVGIVFLLVALVLRFVPKRFHGDGEENED